MREPKLVLVIMGSTRAGRNCPAIAQWVADIGQTRTDLTYEIVDLKAWHLPLDDEPGLPATGAPYAQPHTRAWSEKISSCDAVVFVTPQYNWGYPAALKNAIDHLYFEWREKPTVIVTYGGHGGTKCASQLRQVAEALKMRVITTAPSITLSDDVIRHGGTLHPATDFAEFSSSVEQAMTELAVNVMSEAPNARR
ncbi:NADPH-dependent FMN reductase [Pandoraea sputorum]|uniref:NAD(FAD)-dependent dehydrogenase n=1 Tax=Pandoraea sputorum TaxID=93222 RepID=A0A5E5BI78_9BURK|nr:NADPH-dependent FMN reductase [Pandoraea sputorum]VVE84812.1 NAD(FAD)-dependent dehydrogenase [Pandoraea sputorum]